MNITGLKKKLKKAREMLKEEARKGHYRKNPNKIKKIELGMENLRLKIKEQRDKRKSKKK